MNEKYIPKTPNDLFKSRDPITKTLIEYWRCGFVTWEQMLLELTCLLLEDRARMQSKILKNYQQQTSFLIEKEKK